MTDFRIDHQINAQIAKHLHDMEGVLDEVAITYQILAELLEKQSLALRGPGVDVLRSDLLTLVRQTEKYALSIAEATKFLTSKSERIGERMQALEIDL